MNIFRSICLLWIFSTSLHSQGLVIRDYYGKIVNNDTVSVIFHPDTNHGWTELSKYFYVQNTSAFNVILVAKKTEYAIRSDEYHSICFGGTCFDSSTFVSPFKDPVSYMGIDSTFSGHFRFDDLLHPPGECLVAYTFYDDNNNKDSAIVYVKYNTLQKAGIRVAGKTFFQYLIWPNPAHQFLNISYEIGISRITENVRMQIFNSSGNCVKFQNLVESAGIISFKTDDWKEGIYYLSFSDGIQILSSNKFEVLR